MRRRDHRPAFGAASSAFARSRGQCRNRGSARARRERRVLSLVVQSERARRVAGDDRIQTESSSARPTAPHDDETVAWKEHRPAACPAVCSSPPTLAPILRQLQHGAAHIRACRDERWPGRLWANGRLGYGKRSIAPSSDRAETPGDPRQDGIDRGQAECTSDTQKATRPTLSISARHAAHSSSRANRPLRARRAVLGGPQAARRAGIRTVPRCCRARLRPLRRATC
jgi:hypothetical protein